MSIKTEITRLQNAKASIKTAIEGKGVAVPDGTKLDGMAALVDSISSGGGSSSETWVLNSYGRISSPFTGISFVSNGKTFSSIDKGRQGSLLFLKYDSTRVCWAELHDGDVAWESSRWINKAYRKLTFSTPPSGDLLTWLEANAVKQANDTAVQTDKALTITSNGTTEIAPDVPYDAMSKVNVTVNVRASNIITFLYTSPDDTLTITNETLVQNGIDSADKFNKINGISIIPVSPQSSTSISMVAYGTFPDVSLYNKSLPYSVCLINGSETTSADLNFYYIEGALPYSIAFASSKAGLSAGQQFLITIILSS